MYGAIKLTNPDSHVNEGNVQRKNRVFVFFSDGDRHKIAAAPLRFVSLARRHITDYLLYDQVFQVMVYSTLDFSISAWAH